MRRNELQLGKDWFENWEGLTQIMERPESKHRRSESNVKVQSQNMEGLCRNNYVTLTSCSFRAFMIIGEEINFLNNFKREILFLNGFISVFYNSFYFSVSYIFKTVLVLYFSFFFILRIRGCLLYFLVAAKIGSSTSITFSSRFFYRNFSSFTTPLRYELKETFFIGSNNFIFFRQLLLLCDLFEKKGAIDFQNILLTLTNIKSRFWKYTLFFRRKRFTQKFLCCLYAALFSKDRF